MKHHPYAVSIGIDALLITGHLGAQSLRFIHTSLDREAACTAFTPQNVQGDDDLAALAYRACYDVKRLLY